MTKLERLEHEIGQLKREVVSIRKMVITMVKEPVIVEQLAEESLTEEEKKSMDEALDDWKRGRKDKFVSLEELKKTQKN